MISVIIPVRNTAATIGDQLLALSRQTYTGAWEVIVADNGSTDGTQAICARWIDRLPGLRVIDASQRPGASAARNMGAAAALGSVYAFCDADDMVFPDWLEHCATAAEHHDHIAGALDVFSLNPFPVPAWEARALEAAPVAMSFKPFATSANMVVSSRAFMQVGGFCESLYASEDLDFSWRVQLAGYALHFEPGAVVAKRYRRSLRAACRQSLAWGIADVELFRQFHRFGLEFPLGLGPLYSDGKGAFNRTSGLHIEINSRILVVALALNLGRLLGCTPFGRSLVGHGCGTGQGTETKARVGP